jgi:hypothetical protein
MRPDMTRYGREKHTIHDNPSMRKFLADYRVDIASGEDGEDGRKWLVASLNQQFFVEVRRYREHVRHQVFHGADVGEAIDAYNKA